MECQNLYTAEWKSIALLKQKEKHIYVPSELGLIYMCHNLMQNSKMNCFLTSTTHTSHFQTYCFKIRKNLSRKAIIFKYKNTLKYVEKTAQKP